MTLTVYPDVEQRSPEWFEQRRGIVTASIVGGLLTTRRLTAIDYDCPECGAVKGDSCIGKRGSAITTKHAERAGVAKSTSSPLIIEPASNDTSRDIINLLGSQRATGWVEESWISDAMWRGIEDEPRARDWYREHHAPVDEVGFMARDLGGGVRLGYSPDGLVGDDGLIEIKSRTPKNQYATVISDTVPIEHMPQIQAGLLVSGRAWLDYCSWAGGMAMWVKRVYPDPRWKAPIIEAVRLAEANIVESQRIYAEATEGLPLTPRTIVDELEFS